jgi:predicted kinase
MKQKKIWLLCGIPASGKSSWVAKQNGYCVSRDAVRFSMVNEDEEYFSKEDAVFKEFIRQINKSIITNENTYIDATHINEYSRNKVLDKLNLKDVEIYAVNFLTPFNICFERNAKRKGREKVPDKIMYKMKQNFCPASKYEKYKYNKIIEVKGSE